MTSNNENDQQQQSHFLNNSDELPTSSNEVLKKRSHLLNLMKPSLSLTSLPPQSPKEHASESTSNTERPYNSLKKKRDIEQKELWRRSWESQNSVSTTTTSTGKNDFWAAYNYIMDNSIIDSCREASGEAKSLNDTSGETKILPNLLSKISPFNMTQGSQGSQSLDPKRLRRWLREMESRVSKLPSLKEAMKLNADDLKKFSVESTELYREINSNGRFVGACIRSLEKQNSSKVEEIQIKSLDYTEHDSLDTITTSTTNTSSESKRSENVLKALERRYHLLYLNAFETQCMFEGLLDKRNFFNSAVNIDDFESTDDEFEPIAKIPKIDENTNFSSSKPNNINNNDDGIGTKDIPSDIDADSEDSPDEMECIALKGSDCVDSKTVPIISPKVSNTFIEETDKSFNTPKVVRRSKDISKFNRSNRKSKNCAIFYYKHVDTDNDQVTNNENEQNLASETSEEEIWEYANANQSSQMMDNQEETMIESIQKESEIQCDDDDADLKTNSMQQENIVSNTPQLITKEALRELVLEAESLVLQKMSEKTTKKEYFLNEVLAKTNVRKNLHKKVMEKNQKDTAKINRVQEWLKHNHNTVEIKNGQSITLQLTDCEASFEYTSCSDSSEEITDSVATCLQGIDQLQTSTEGLENFSPVHKVKMRGKTSDNRRHSERPWSVSCISQLTRNARQSFSDAKVAEATNVLANFSISESALNNLQKDRTTSESDSKNCNNNKNAVNSVGSKNSLKKRKTKLRKKSLSSNRKSDSGSEIHANIIKTMSKSDSFNMTLMEDLSTAISMMSFMKDNNSNNSEQVAQKAPTESEDEQVIKTPDFKIGSITSVYGNPYSMNLGSLAALANYNNENCEATEIPTENLSSISEHNMWDNYMEKYNSEAYSEDRDIDGARKLLDFGDDYRNFIDSQSDCCSSLSCANQIDSLSPPRHRRNMSKNISLPSSNDNSMQALRQQRIQELPETERQKDRSVNNFLEKLRQKSNEYEFTATTKSKSSQQSLLSSTKPVNISSSDDEETKENKIIAECEKMLEQTQSLQNANPQLLRPEDYDEIIKTCLINIQRLENIPQSDDLNQMKVNALIASWNRLLNWSENAAGIRRLQQEIAEQKQLLNSMEITDDWVLNSEEAIRDKIQELNATLGELYKHRSNMLKLNASVHSYISKETNKQNILRSEDHLDNTQSSQYDVDALADEELHKQLKDEIVSLYAKWDSINLIITSKLENLKHSLVCWKQIENGLEELKENLSKDRGALNGLKGAIEEGSSSPEELVDNVQQISKLLSEKLENRIQTISTNEDFMLHPEAALKFIANSSSNPSYQSDSGISDGGFSELSERERRLIALKKIAKQLESALSPSSEVLKTITQRMEAAENELKVLQNTCRELILRTSTELLKQQGLDVSSHKQSQINVQIPIITIKPTTKSKRSNSRRNKERNRSMYSERRSDNNNKKVEPKLLTNDTTSESDPDEPKTKQWRMLKRVAKLAMPFQLTVVTLFCIAWFFEPRCCDTLNNLSMSLTPQLRYINGPPPT